MGIWTKRYLSRNDERPFIQLTRQLYHITSFPPLFDRWLTPWFERRLKRYNCIAYAAGDNTRIWWPDPSLDFYWPPNAPSREQTVGCFVSTFRLFDYEEIRQPVAQAALAEPGIEKVAIYWDPVGSPTKGTFATQPQHAARQMVNGNWRSKLGRYEIIEHSTLECLNGECPAYGEPIRVLRRKRRNFIQRFYRWLFRKDKARI